MTMVKIFTLAMSRYAIYAHDKLTDPSKHMSTLICIFTSEQGGVGTDMVDNNTNTIKARESITCKVCLDMRRTLKIYTTAMTRSIVMMICMYGD